MSRRHITLKTKLAAALCNMLRAGDDGKYTPVIPYAEAKLLTEDEVLARFQFDHYPLRKVDGGPDAHWNLMPLAVADHRRKTATRDIPEIAKAKRLTPAHIAFCQRVLSKPCGANRARSTRWAKRSFSKRRTGEPAHMGGGA